MDEEDCVTYGRVETFFTFAWPAGILQRIKETNEDINLYIFNSSGDWSRDDDYNVGEYNIYRLPDLNDFDGIIVDVNNIRYPDVREYVVEAAKRTGKPVISVASEIEDFYYVGIDNYAAMREMIEHLYEKHGCRRFWFVMGPEDNYENRIRVAAVRDFLQEHGIIWREDDIYCENYEYRCGMNGFTGLYEKQGVLPDAIVCGSDNIAVGVCETAAKYGYHAPADFLVTGFDDFDKASYYSPRLTTVGHIREEVGYRCVEIFLKLWSGQQVPRFNYTGHQCVFRESCGCSDGSVVDQVMRSKDQIVYGIETDEFEEQVLSLEYELLRCKTVKEMSYWIPRCIPAMRCDAMYLIVDEHINEFKHAKDYYDRRLIEDEEFCVHGYPKNMQIEFAYKNGKIVDDEDKAVTGLFPLFDAPKGGVDFLFMPLHFKEYTVGYLVIRNAVYLMEKQYLFQIVNVLTSAMENLHKKEKLEYMNQILANLYVKDAMTGLYNRLGYQKLAGSLFEKQKKRGENMAIVFMDMDRLKYINDQFGHSHGDWVIKTIAEAILNHIPKDSIAVRFGGDEFLLILGEGKEKAISSMVQKIRDEITSKASEMKLPIPLTVSVGCIYTDMKTDRNLDDYVREADEVMYREKNAKKVERE